jgi:hypothetical protein
MIQKYIIEYPEYNYNHHSPGMPLSIDRPENKAVPTAEPVAFPA